MSLISIGLCGLLGVFARYYLWVVVGKQAIAYVPLATMLINICGSFCAGVMYGLAVERNYFSPQVSLGIMVGFLGGFTTFSTFSLETVMFFERGESLRGLVYLVLSPLLGFIGAYSGIVVTRYLSART